MVKCGAVAFLKAWAIITEPSAVAPDARIYSTLYSSLTQLGPRQTDEPECHGRFPCLATTDIYTRAYGNRDSPG